jgi:hypothetical protein
MRIASPNSLAYLPPLFRERYFNLLNNFPKACFESFHGLRIDGQYRGIVLIQTGFGLQV